MFHQGAVGMVVLAVSLVIIGVAMITRRFELAALGVLAIVAARILRLLPAPDHERDDDDSIDNA